jgi:hypothetical protein
VTYRREPGFFRSRRRAGQRFLLPLSLRSLAPVEALNVSPNAFLEDDWVRVSDFAAIFLRGCGLGEEKEMWGKECGPGAMVEGGADVLGSNGGVLLLRAALPGLDIFRRASSVLAQSIISAVIRRSLGGLLLSIRFLIIRPLAILS